MRHGFSLVELSIVLVILGLLTGGILGGQALIRAAELRTASTQASQFRTSFSTFRDKYFAWPGDMNNATRFWGDNNTACADGAITNGTPGTCNGDADGLIDVASGASATGEIYQAWTQLAYAGIIEGSYSGVAGSGGAHASTAGTNIPQGRLSNSGWFLQYIGTEDGTNAWYYAMTYGNILSVGAVTATWPYGTFLKGEEAWNIDIKMDDGLPGQGALIAGAKDTCSLASSGTDYSAAYNLSASGTNCALVFRRIF